MQFGWHVKDFLASGYDALVLAASGNCGQRQRQLPQRAAILGGMATVPSPAFAPRVLTGGSAA
jgi:hypothetical protein